MTNRSVRLRVKILRIARTAPSLPAVEIAKRAGCHPDTARRHLTRAGIDRPQRPLTGSERMRAAGGDRDALRRCGRDLDPVVRGAVAADPGCPPEMIARLAADPHPARTQAEVPRTPTNSSKRFQNPDKRFHLPDKGFHRSGNRFQDPDDPVPLS